MSSCRRDTILRSFKLDEEEFRVVRKKRTTKHGDEIIYLGTHTLNGRPSTGGAGKEDRWYGYIHFRSLHGKGTVTVANFSSTLQPWYSGLCATRHTDNSHGPENTGDCLKVAILALARGPKNHHIKCRSDKLQWYFGFTAGRRLLAALQPTTPETNGTANTLPWSSSEATLIPVGAQPDADTEFVIGEDKMVRDERGIPRSGTAVTLEEFEDWTKAALFLYEVGDDDGVINSIVSTQEGDLLMHRNLSGHIYLHGLLLHPHEFSRPATWAYRFGYNFKLHSRKQAHMDTKEGERLIAAIWETVLSVRPKLVSELSDMLDSLGPHYEDAWAVKQHASLAMAKQLQQYLFQKPWPHTWYYRSGDIEKVCLMFHLDWIIPSPCSITDTFGSVEPCSEPRHPTSSMSRICNLRSLLGSFAQLRPSAYRRRRGTSALPRRTLG